jgi:hypothetical protein
MDEQLKHFAENGFVVVEGALTPEEIAAVNDGIDADAAANSKEWEPGPRPGFVTVGCGAPELMHRTEALDRFVHHPSLDPFVKRILGEDAQFSALSFMRREPCNADAPEDFDGGDPLALSRNWHREYSGIVEGADRNDYYAPGIQIIYYLDDVDDQSHCTSIIPESAETKRKLPKTREGGSSWGESALRIDDSETGGFVDPEKPTWMDSFGREFPRRIGRVDINGRAGTAIVFNMASYHCGTVRKTDRFRRTTHVFYRQPEPRSSRHALTGDFESVEAFHEALPKRLQ